ncbi:MAG TPA: TlyA family RNA methyltransferase, partial [Acidimicrobiia bacterium]|nr:TlyA family RNA methyltransferase [Acidimicrobiia bacterium]
MATPRRRLDRELVVRGLAADRDEALALVADQRVLVDGAPALTPDRLVGGQADMHVLRPARAYASRGGEKLAGALDDLGLSPAGRRCLDAGAGHGGFTDCLLQRGANSVVAVDVGYGDLDWTLRTDPRVQVIERCNIRTADPAELGAPFDLVVADLSFISLAAVAGVLTGATAPEGDLLVLVKPQFEAPPSDVEAGGIVTDPEVWAATIRTVAAAFRERGLGTAGLAASRLKGAS